MISLLTYIVGGPVLFQHNRRNNRYGFNGNTIFAVESSVVFVVVDLLLSFSCCCCCCCITCLVGSFEEQHRKFWELVS